MKIHDPLIFSTDQYKYLKDSICELGNFEIGNIENKLFPDGELYQRITSKVVDRDIVLIGGTTSDSNTLQIYDLSCAMVKYGAKTLTLIVPYYGYSTMERAIKDGEVVKAKTRARLFSSIPQASEGNRIVLVDLHSEGIPHYFEGSIRAIHLYAKDVIIDAIKTVAGEDDFVLASTDAGRAKWVESLAFDIGVTPSFIYKKRLSGEETKVSAINAHVEGKHAVIYDDMIRTGSSLINAAKAYLDAGATKVSAVATHGIFPANSLQKIKDTNYFQKIICTDSHPRILELKNDFLLVKSIDKLLYQYLIE
ncbi:MAG: ribose-phosphate pyrophosphokinase [Candidatus Sericytochromatia bacterium]|nr:ribose-phosphate pyrophosphokinase [Candidatus Sericytochromatia bacterium]